MAKFSNQGFFEITLRSRNAEGEPVEKQFSSYFDYDDNDLSDTLHDLEAWRFETPTVFCGIYPALVELRMTSDRDTENDNITRTRITEEGSIGGGRNLCKWVAVQLAKFTRLIQAAEEAENEF